MRRRMRSSTGSGANCAGRTPPRRARMPEDLLDAANGWPPVYDEGYLPDLRQRYWCPERETMAPAARDAFVLRRLQAIVRWAWKHSPFYREKWTAAGVHPDHLVRLTDLHRFPVVTKAELRREQA